MDSYEIWERSNEDIDRVLEILFRFGKLGVMH